jgi:hypothetical protein
MRLFTHAALVAALAFPALRSTGGENSAPANCSGSLQGNTLVTSIEFTDGYSVEAPWRVTQTRLTARQDGAPRWAIAANLDRIVERETANARPVTTPFPAPIETTFEGKDDDDAVFQAAQIWCLTVIKVKNEGGSLVPARQSTPIVKAALRSNVQSRPFRAAAPAV